MNEAVERSSANGCQVDVRSRVAVVMFGWMSTSVMAEERELVERRRRCKIGLDN